MKCDLTSPPLWQAQLSSGQLGPPLVQHSGLSLDQSLHIPHHLLFSMRYDNYKIINHNQWKIRTGHYRLTSSHPQQNWHLFFNFNSQSYTVVIPFMDKKMRLRVSRVSMCLPSGAIPLRTGNYTAIKSPLISTDVPWSNTELSPRKCNQNASILLMYHPSFYSDTVPTDLFTLVKISGVLYHRPWKSKLEIPPSVSPECVVLLHQLPVEPLSVGDSLR